MKLAIFFPGIGYTNDKPLMYYSRKIMKSQGFDELCIEYRNLPGKVRGNIEKLMEALEMAYSQTLEQIQSIDFTQYEEVALVGKSIGTVIAVRVACKIIRAAFSGGKEQKSNHSGLITPHIRLVLLTPVEATFTPNSNHTDSLSGVFSGADSLSGVFSDAVAFIGTSDPWSDLSEVKRLANECNVPLHLYPNCNHSLESGDVVNDLEVLKDVLAKLS